MICDIFIRTWHRDSEWLKYCIKSIKKYGSGFRDIVVVYPEGEDCCSLYSDTSFSIKEICAAGYIDQMVSKFNCYEYCKPGVTHILFLDSDCCFTQHFTPESYMQDGKPFIYMTPYKYLCKEGQLWKKLTEDALKFNVEYEFMRQLPIMYTIDAIKDFKQWFFDIKGITIEQFLVDISINMYSDTNKACFSEFNAIGSYLYYIRQKNDHFFADTTQVSLRPKLCAQKWSWGGLNDEIKNELEEYTK